MIYTALTGGTRKAMRRELAQNVAIECYACMSIGAGTELGRVAQEEEVAACEDSSCISPELKAIYGTQREWTWRGYSIAYTVQGNGPPVLLVHGFGASIGHWRR